MFATNVVSVQCFSNERIDLFLARPCPALLVFLPRRSMFGQLLSQIRKSKHVGKGNYMEKKSSNIL